MLVLILVIDLLVKKSPGKEGLPDWINAPIAHLKHAQRMLYPSTIDVDMEYGICHLQRVIFPDAELYNVLLVTLYRRVCPGLSRRTFSAAPAASKW